MRRFMNTAASFLRKNNAYIILVKSIYDLSVISAGIISYMTKNSDTPQERALFLTQLTYLRFAFLAPRAVIEGGLAIQAIKHSRSSDERSIQSPSTTKDEAGEDEDEDEDEKEEVGAYNTLGEDVTVEAKRQMLVDTRSSKTTFLRIVVAQGNLTVDLVNWGIRHKLDPNAPGVSITNHTVGFISDPVYILANLPVFTGNTDKDVITPQILLGLYAVFLIIYQKGFKADSPYAPDVDLNSDDSLLSWLDISVLPVVTPLINTLIIKLEEKLQRTLHGHKAPPEFTRVYPSFSVCCGALRSCTSTVLNGIARTLHLSSDEQPSNIPGLE